MNDGMQWISVGSLKVSYLVNKPSLGLQAGGCNEVVCKILKRLMLEGLQLGVCTKDVCKVSKKVKLK